MDILASDWIQSAEQGGSFLPTNIWKNIQRKDSFQYPLEGHEPLVYSFPITNHQSPITALHA
jgi:hypothetical protein